MMRGFINKQKADYENTGTRLMLLTVRWRCLFFVRNVVFFFFVALLIPLFSRCTETIDLDLKSTTQRLVVEGMITDDPHMCYLRLTESVPFMIDSASPNVSDAKVSILDGYQTIEFREVSGNPGYYVAPSDFEGIPGRTYELSISGVDIGGDGEKERYEASCYMPFVNRPDSIDLVYDNSWEVWKVLLYASDNTDTEDYYLFRLLKNGTLISDNISEYSVVSDKFFEDGRADGIWVQSIDVETEDQDFQEGDIITLEMCGITKEYYKFIQAVQRENRKQYPLFSGPPANAPGNISNNALGFFPAFSVSYKSYQFRGDEKPVKNSLLVQ
jgi:hypothetical protein